MPALPSRIRFPAFLLAGALATGAACAAPPPGDDTAHEHKAKQALDDRVDPSIRSDDVGRGTHLGSKPTQPGTYLGDKSRAAVRRYYGEHPAGATPAPAAWQIGMPLPRDARVGPVPAPLLASLPKAPPGVSYVRTGGDILLVANGSRMVVDGIQAP